MNETLQMRGLNMSLFKNSRIKIFLLLACLFGTITGHAELLKFREGEGAAYKISTHRNAHYHFFGFPGTESTQTDLHLEVKILSSNPETQSYPFEIELICRDFQGIEIEGNGKVTVFNVNELETHHSTHLSKILHHLMNQPLRFIINENNVQTTADYLSLEQSLAEINAENEGMSFDLDTIFEDVHEFLARLFHLSNQDLKEGHTYEALTPLQDENLITTKSLYRIDQIYTDTIKGTFDFEGFLEDFNATLKEEVEWRIDNPLVQQRTLFAESQSIKDITLLKGHYLINQTWEAVPLEIEPMIPLTPPSELEVIFPEEINWEITTP